MSSLSLQSPGRPLRLAVAMGCALLTVIAISAGKWAAAGRDPARLVASPPEIGTCWIDCNKFGPRLALYMPADYSWEILAQVSDPEGPDDIASVTVTFPGGSPTYPLNDEGEDGDRVSGDGNYQRIGWQSTPSPVGVYEIVATDSHGLCNNEACLLSDSPFPSVPTPVAPAHGGIVSTTTPTLEWQESTDASSGYQVMVWDAPPWEVDWDFSHVVWQTGRHYMGTSVIVPESYLKRGRTYHWLAVAENSMGGNSRYTPEYASFTVEPFIAVGYVQIGCGTFLSYRAKYYSITNTLPDSVWVCIWSPGAGVSWRTMWALHPGDTNCLDGKWYTYSTQLRGGEHAYRFAASVGGSWIYYPDPPGSYKPGPSVNPVLLSSGYVTPTAGTRSTTFTWRVKYWNTLNQPPDQVWCAIWWGSRGQAFWYPMWALDPSDTNYCDGKWYTLSTRWLDSSAHAFRFAARQGSNWAYWPKPTGSYESGPTVGP